MHFQITLTSEHVAGYGLVPFSELRDRGRKNKKASLVKYKSADNYVGRPNKSNCIPNWHATRVSNDHSFVCGRL